MSLEKKVVYIVEDDKLQREYLRRLLESAHFIVKGYESAEDFLLDFDPLQSSCLLLDVILPDISGLELKKQLQSKGIEIPIIFVSAHADVAMARAALKTGGVDILEKPINTVELMEAVTTALIRDKEIRRHRLELSTIDARLACLTPREREILNLLVAGNSNKEIAENLHLSLRTIETHRNNILKKMRVKSFPDLLRIILSGD